MSRITTIRESIKNNKKRSIAIAAAGLIAVSCMGAPVAMSLFSGSDSAATHVAAGHVEIHVTKALSASNLLPGTSKSVPITLDNSKSSAGVNFSISDVAGLSVNNPGGSDLSKLTISIVDSKGSVVYGPVAANAVKTGALKGVSAPAGGSWSGNVVWSLAADAGNEYQDVAVYYSAVTFAGTQATGALSPLGS